MTRLVYCLVSASIAFSGPTFFAAFLYLYFCVGHASRKIPRSWGWEESIAGQLFGASGSTGTAIVTTATSMASGDHAASTQVSELGLEQLLQMVRAIVREERAMPPHQVSSNTSTTTTVAVSGPLPIGRFFSATCAIYYFRYRWALCPLQPRSCQFQRVIHSGNPLLMHGVVASQHSGVPLLTPQNLPALGSSIATGSYPLPLEG